MANDRHRAVARARHRMEVSKKAKHKMWFESLTLQGKIDYVMGELRKGLKEVMVIIENAIEPFCLSLKSLREIFKEDPMKERELLKQYRCEVVNAYGEKMDIILTARSLYEAEQEAKKSYDQISDLVEIPASGTLF